MIEPRVFQLGRYRIVDLSASEQNGLRIELRTEDALGAVIHVPVATGRKTDQMTLPADLVWKLIARIRRLEDDREWEAETIPAKAETKAGHQNNGGGQKARAAAAGAGESVTQRVRLPSRIVGNTRV